MSMSQEEIEALMSGLDIADEEPSAAVNEPEVEEPVNNIEEPVLEESIDDIIAQVNNEEHSASNDSNENIKDDIADVLNEIDNMKEDEVVITESELNKIDLVNEPADKKIVSYDELNEEAKNWTDEKINKGEFPLPVEPNTKVVSQLNEVANDSEEKAGKIFDVLSDILDHNSDLTTETKKIDNFLEKEVALLNSLVLKFPNISVFQARLDEAKSLNEVTSGIRSKLDNENNQLFEAMELMQFHDINRQKIERVMAVIRKLSNYLNNLFEEDGEYKEIAVAKHIHGDNNSDLMGTDDLDALIAEFSK